MPQSRDGLLRMGKDRWKARFRFVSPTTGELIDTERTFAAKNKLEAKAERDRLLAELRDSGPQTRADRARLREFALAWYEARRPDHVPTDGPVLARNCQNAIGDSSNQ